MLLQGIIFEKWLDEQRFHGNIQKESHKLDAMNDKGIRMARVWGCCAWAFLSSFAAAGEDMNVAALAPRELPKAAQKKFVAFPGITGPEPLAGLVRQYLAALDRGYRLRTFSITPGKDKTCVMSLQLEDEQGWGESVEFDVTEAMGGEVDRHGAQARRLEESMSSLMGEPEFLYRSGSALAPIELEPVDTLEQIDERMRDYLRKNEPPCEWEGSVLTRGILKKHRNHFLQALSLVNKRGQRKLLYFDLTDAYRHLEESGDATVKEEVRKRKKLYGPGFSKKETALEKETASGSNAASFGSLRLQGSDASLSMLKNVGDLAMLKTALKQYAIARGAAYRLTGFSMPPVSPVNAGSFYVALFLQDEDGWGETVLFDAKELGAHWDNRRGDALTALATGISSLAEKDSFFPRYYGSSRYPVMFPEVDSISRIEEWQRTFIRQREADCLVDHVIDLLDEDRDGKERFLEVVTLKDSRGRAKLLHFDMTRAYRSLERSDEASQKLVRQLMKRHKARRETDLVSRFFRNLPEASSQMEPYLPFDAGSIVEFHDRLTQFVEDLDMGYRIQGFTPLKSSESALVAMHLENRQGWRQTIVLDLTRVSRRIDRSPERAAEKLRAALDRIASGVPRFYGSYAGSWGSIAIGNVHSVDELEKREKEKIARQFSGCKILSSRLQVYGSGCKDLERYAEVWTLQNDLGQQKDVYIELTDAYMELEESADPAIRQQAAARKALHQPAPEPVRNAWWKR